MSEAPLYQVLILNLKSPFLLGDRNQNFVSGSNAIEVSSSNFHLTPEGNVTMRVPLPHCW